MKPYAELLEFNQPNPVRKEGFTRIRDAFPGLRDRVTIGLDGELLDPERIVEFAGRWDYGEKNAKKLGEAVKVKYVKKTASLGFSTVTSADQIQEKEVPIVQKYIDMGHESMLEMADATFFIECSRVVSHELVRHRIPSYQQESQRFVRYEDVDEFSDVELDALMYHPEFGGGPMNDNGVWTAGAIYHEHVRSAFSFYKRLREKGVPPQLARYVLPNAMRTRMVMKTNLREWRHICKLRLDKSAQPEMQELVQQVYDQLVDIFPNVMYNAIEGERGVR